MEKRPAKKIINMAYLIKSGIDCEFSDYPDFSNIWVGKLTGGSGLNFHRYSCDSGDGYKRHAKYCRPRMNHKMLHDGGDCPLPEGFRVKLLTICGGRLQHSTGLSSVTKAGNVWKDADYYPVIGYEILGLADGYAYKLESDE